MGTCMDSEHSEGVVRITCQLSGSFSFEWNQKNSKCYSVPKLKALEDTFYSEWIKI